MKSIFNFLKFSTKVCLRNFSKVLFIIDTNHKKTQIVKKYALRQDNFFYQQIDMKLKIKQINYNINMTFRERKFNK